MYTHLQCKKHAQYNVKEGPHENSGKRSKRTHALTVHACNNTQNFTVCDETRYHTTPSDPIFEAFSHIMKRVKNCRRTKAPTIKPSPRRCRTRWPPPGRSWCGALAPSRYPRGSPAPSRRDKRVRGHPPGLRNQP